MDSNLIQYLYPIGLILSAIIHLIPSRVLIDKDSIKKLYGIESIDLNSKLIVLHRASFFLFISIFNFFSLYFSSLLDVAYFLNAFSILSFIIIYSILSPEEPKWKKVFWTDVFLILILTIVYCIHKKALN